MDAPPIIPRPLHAQRLPGRCLLPPCITIACHGGAAPGIARHLAAFLEELDLRVDVQAAAGDGGAAAAAGAPPGAPPAGARLVLAHAPGSVAELAALPHAGEAYELRAGEAGVAVRALAPHGLFNGVVSLLQLLPARAPLDADVALDCVHVRRPAPPV